jgi:hypothetical protein
MNHLQPITHNGQLVAAVIQDHAVIITTLPALELRHVQAMCHYAMLVQAGELPGPYTDRQADAYARLAVLCAPPVT